MLGRALLGFLGVVLGGMDAQATGPVCWAGQGIRGTGPVYDAPNGKVIGHLEDDTRTMVVDHWEGDWVLFTSWSEPRVGWPSALEFVAQYACADMQPET